MIAVSLISPHEVMRDLAARAKRRRLAENLTQDGLAKCAQVSLGSLKAFERDGKASLKTVVLLAFALGAEREFEALFPEDAPPALTMCWSGRRGAGEGAVRRRWPPTGGRLVVQFDHLGVVRRLGELAWSGRDRLT